MLLDCAALDPLPSTCVDVLAGRSSVARAGGDGVWLRDAVVSGLGAAAGSARWEDGVREGLLRQLTSDGALERAVAQAGHVDDRRRSLPGAVTAGVVLGLALHMGEGYDSVLAKTVPHLDAGTRLPGEVPTASGLSAARARLGPEPMRRFFQHTAATGAGDGPGSRFAGLTVTAFDGTCLEAPADEALIERYGRPTGAARPQVRVVALATVGNRKIIDAAAGSYHTGEQDLADRLAGALRPGTVNLADRAYFSMDRWLRFADTGAELVWRVKFGPQFPGRALQRLSDGSVLVRLRESQGMRTRRRKNTSDPDAPFLPDTVARMIEFDVTVTDRHGAAENSRIRILTTMLDPDRHPAGDLARLYAERWQIEVCHA